LKRASFYGTLKLKVFEKMKKYFKTNEKNNPVFINNVMILNFKKLGLMKNLKKPHF
jgi:hypothetical protein